MVNRKMINTKWTKWTREDAIGSVREYIISITLSIFDIGTITFIISGMVSKKWR